MQLKTKGLLEPAAPWEMVQVKEANGGLLAELEEGELIFRKGNLLALCYELVESRRPSLETWAELDNVC
jgi:hypothetical protein